MVDYRKEKRFYKIRKTTSNNVYGDTYAVTIPKEMIKTFKDTYFQVIPDGKNIVMQSGCPPWRQ